MKNWLFQLFTVSFFVLLMCQLASTKDDQPVHFEMGWLFSHYYAETRRLDFFFFLGGGFLSHFNANLMPVTVTVPSSNYSLSFVWICNVIVMFFLNQENRHTWNVYPNISASPVAIPSDYLLFHVINCVMCWHLADYARRQCQKDAKSKRNWHTVTGANGIVPGPAVRRDVSFYFHGNGWQLMKYLPSSFWGVYYF